MASPSSGGDASTATSAVAPDPCCALAHVAAGGSVACGTPVAVGALVAAGAPVAAGALVAASSFLTALYVYLCVPLFGAL